MKMLDLQQLRIIAQLIDNIEINIEELEKSYKKHDLENFQNSKKEILKFQKQISENLIK